MTEALTMEQQIYDALTVAVEAVCESRCPSKWRTKDPQPHSEECRKVKAARSAWMDHCSTLDLIASGGLPAAEGITIAGATHIKVVDVIYGNSSLNMTPEACSKQAHCIAAALIAAGLIPGDARTNRA